MDDILEYIEACEDRFLACKITEDVLSFEEWDAEDLDLSQLLAA